MKNSQIIFLQLKEKVPSDSYLALKQSLDTASEQKLATLLLLNFKNPIIGLIFSVFLPGVDRIYKGDLVLGVIKILLFWGSYIALNMGVYIEDANLILSSFAVLFCGSIWVLIDIFLVYRGIKMYNLSLIFNALRD